MFIARPGSEKVVIFGPTVAMVVKPLQPLPIQRSILNPVSSPPELSFQSRSMVVYATAVVHPLTEALKLEGATGMIRSQLTPSGMPVGQLVVGV